MINTNNYFTVVTNDVVASFPETLKKGHEYVIKVTGGNSWSNYDASESIRKVIDLYFTKVNEFLSTQVTHQPVTTPKTEKNKRETKKTPKVNPQVQTTSVQLVERIPDELKFMRRFVNLNGKTKTKEEILRFINSLQRAIVEKRIRKTSPHATAVRFVQSKLIELYNTMRSKVSITLTPESLGRLKDAVQSESIMPDIQFLKKYIALNGKKGIKEKVARLIKQMDKAHDKGKLYKNSPYADAIDKAYKNLVAYERNKVDKPLLIEQAELNGLNGVLNGKGGLNGITNDNTGVQIMNSMDFVKMRFEKLGFTGKWRELIGDPSPGFTAMVYGKPKLGKSFFCVEFAGYLARNHGKVLYIAKEEGIDSTLQDKLNEKEVRHPNLDVASGLPTDLSMYKFIFLDSVTRLNLEPEDLEHLKLLWPGKSFIYVFQTTKMGNFRGAQSFMHDVDVILHVPEKGKVVQMGRFNQGGEMEIFAQAA